MEKKKAGRPKKYKTITPGLRIDSKVWTELTEKYPRSVNKMFTEWVSELLK